MTDSRLEHWHVISPEYPPNIGGVGDHSRLLAIGLAKANQQVTVWTASPLDPLVADEGFQVCSVGKGFTPAALGRLDVSLSAYPSPRRLVVQWVPHGYGYKSLNLPFCLWVAQRAARGDRIDLIVHEAYLSFSRSNWKQSAAALVHRLMITALLAAANRVWISIPAWQARLKPYALGRKLEYEWLPVPSNVPVTATAAEKETIRQQFLPPGTRWMIGHFSTTGASIRELLSPLAAKLLQRNPAAVILLIGSSSNDYAGQLRSIHPELACRIFATGALSTHQISAHLAACDLALQPYPDGISSRRGSAMAALSHGVPLLTNTGLLSEPFWRERPQLSVVNNFEDLINEADHLLNDARAREAIGTAGKQFYESTFSSTKMVERLLEARSTSSRTKHPCA